LNGVFNTTANSFAFQDVVTQRRIIFALQSEASNVKQWGVELLTIRAFDGTIQLRSRTGLLSAIVDYVRDEILEPSPTTSELRIPETGLCACLWTHLC
jgi:hypothetical protein